MQQSDSVSQYASFYYTILFSSSGDFILSVIEKRRISFQLFIPLYKKESLFEQTIIS